MMASDKLLREAWRRFLVRAYKEPCEAGACSDCTDICLCPVPSDDPDFHLPTDVMDYLHYRVDTSGEDAYLAILQYAYEVWQGWRSARWDYEEVE